MTNTGAAIRQEGGPCQWEGFLMGFSQSVESAGQHAWDGRHKPQKDGSWRHTLVLPRVDRETTCMCWAPREHKFAVGSGARIVSVCYEEDKYWWVAKHIKRPIRSTIITALALIVQNCGKSCGSR